MSTPPDPDPRSDDRLTEGRRWWGRPLAESRWALELARLSVDPVLLGRGVARGDGRPVVLMPGFLAGDPTLLMLATWLRRIGHRPYGCGFVANVDCSDRALERVDRRVEELHHRHGRRVALVGHSRGGHFARALAHRRPDRVSHAVSLGADLQRMFGISVPTQAAVIAARRGVAVMRRGRTEQCLTADCPCAFTRDFAAPIPTDRVRFTSVYSKGDGIVDWPGSVIAGADNVEVTGSHVGLIFNRKAYRAIADALALPEIT
jgi:triacylglycerol lipase